MRLSTPSRTMKGGNSDCIVKSFLTSDNTRLIAASVQVVKTPVAPESLRIYAMRAGGKVSERGTYVDPQKKHAIIETKI